MMFSKSLKILQLAVVVAVISIVSGQGWYCFQVIQRNCYKYGHDPQCGSNNFTFYNKCEFSQGHCKEPNVHLAHSGVCYNESHTHGLTHGEEISLQFVCQELSTHECPDDFDLICGSDGITYRNMCDYEIRRCMHPEMTIAHKGACNTRAHILNRILALL